MSRETPPPCRQTPAAYGLAVALAAALGVLAGYTAARGTGGPDGLDYLRERVAVMAKLLDRMDDRLTRVAIKLGADDDLGK